MNPSSKKGNNPELWDKFLQDLDERLQFGLLEPLRKIHSYHFEGDALFVEVSLLQDFNYLNKQHVLQQFRLLASQSTGVNSVEVKLKETEKS